MQRRASTSTTATTGPKVMSTTPKLTLVVPANQERLDSANIYSSPVPSTSGRGSSAMTATPQLTLVLPAKQDDLEEA